jgi:hypothetical protein
MRNPRASLSGLALAAALCATLCALLCAALSSCSTAKPVALQLESIPQEKARRELARPLLAALRDFGNAMAGIMLESYRFASIAETGKGDYLYRFDAADFRYPRHAYIVVRLGASPSISTNRGGKNHILLDSGSIGLVPTDAPAVISGGSFSLAFTKGNFREAFNPWVIGARGGYPEQLLLWFSNPATKDEDIRRLASLLKSAFPAIAYKAQ